MTRSLPCYFTERSRKPQCKLAQTQYDLVVAALRRARMHIAEDSKSLIEGACVLDKETLEPDLSTLDDFTRPHVEQLQALLAEIDHALGDQR